MFSYTTILSRSDAFAIKNLHKRVADSSKRKARTAVPPSNRQRIVGSFIEGDIKGLAQDDTGICVPLSDSDWVTTVDRKPCPSLQYKVGSTAIITVYKSILVSPRQRAMAFYLQRPSGLW
jgi:hypothetical protein